MAMAVVLSAGALAACGADGRPAGAAAGPETSGGKPVGKVVAGSVAQFADCSDWRSGTRPQRMATIRDIRGQHTPQRSTTAASPLADERAYALFEKACAPSYAKRLRLYKLYVKAQGFAPLSE